MSILPERGRLIQRHTSQNTLLLNNHSIRCMNIVAFYSLCSKMIVLLLGFLCPKMIVRLFVQLKIGIQNQIFPYKTFYVKKSFDVATFEQLSGLFRSSCFLLQESYLQLFSQRSKGLNLAQVRNLDDPSETK